MSTKTPVELHKEKLNERRLGSQATMANVRLTSDFGIDRTLRLEAMGTLKTIIETIADTADLDLSKSVKVIGKGEFGHVGDAISLIASKMNWPLPAGSHDSPEDMKEEILTALSSANISLDMGLLDEIREARGNHSFMNNENGEIIDATEPEYEEIHYLMLEVAKQLDLPILDWKLTEDRWNKAETKAAKKVNAQVAEIDATQALKDSVNK